MEQIIDRLAAAIKGVIRCNREVISLDVKDEGVQVTWREAGKRYTKHCDFVLCTIPFSVLRKIELIGFDESDILLH